MQIPAPKLILASASSARRDMLTSAGLVVETRPARVDEATIKASMTAEGHPARDIADALAQAKALKIALKCPGELVLGADQVLVLDGEVFDKPEDLGAAADHLRRLRGATHRLLSAVVIMKDTEVTFRHIGEARLTMRPLSDEFIDGYVETAGQSLCQTVGAYQLEGLGAQLFSRISGDYFTILGLPLLEVLAHLRDRKVLLA